MRRNFEYPKRTSRMSLFVELCFFCFTTTRMWFQNYSLEQLYKWKIRFSRIRGVDFSTCAIDALGPGIRNRILWDLTPGGCNEYACFRISHQFEVPVGPRHPHIGVIFFVFVLSLENFFLFARFLINFLYQPLSTHSLLQKSLSKH